MKHIKIVLIYSTLALIATSYYIYNTDRPPEYEPTHQQYLDYQQGIY